MSQPEGRRTDDSENVPGGGAEAGEQAGSADAGGASREGRVGTRGAGAGEGSPQREAGALREPSASGQLNAGRSPLFEVNALKVEQARSALARTDDLVHEALQSNPDRGHDETKSLAMALHEPLIEAPKDHSAIFGANYASELGLPVTICDPASAQWRLIWQLWMHYFALGSVVVYENERASQLIQQGEEAD